MQGAAEHDLGEDGERFLEVHPVGQFALVVRNLALASLVNLVHKYLLGLLDLGVETELLVHGLAEFGFGNLEFFVDGLFELLDFLLNRRVL